MAFTGGIKRVAETTLVVNSAKEFSTEKSGLMDSFIRASQQKGLVDEIKAINNTEVHKLCTIQNILKNNIEGFSDDEAEALAKQIKDELYRKWHF